MDMCLARAPSFGQFREPEPRIATLVVRILAAALAFIPVPASVSAQVQDARLEAADKDENDMFGWWLSLDGDRALVGSVGDDDVVKGSGSAYVFDKVGGTWTQTAKLVSPHPVQYGAFGRAVVVAGDHAFVGEPLGSPNAVHEFVIQGGFWSLAQSIAPPAGSSSEFGITVAVDGERMLIAASNGSNQPGVVFVYDRVAGPWIHTATLLPPSGSNHDGFGLYLDLDGDRAVVGETSFGQGTGAAFVYERNASNGSWHLTATLSPTPSAPGDNFGVVAIDGERIAVGSIGSSTTGCVFVFEYIQPAGMWSQTDTIHPQDTNQPVAFGESVDIDGVRILVGSPTQGPVGEGAAYLYEQNGTGWSFASKLGPESGDNIIRFGSAVQLDDGTAIIGAPQQGLNYGAAYIWDLSCIPPVIFGAGCPGAFGLVPTFAVGGCPKRGNAISIDVANALGGANLFLVVGTQPAAIPIGAGCMLNVGPSPVILGPVPLSGAGSGGGSVSLANLLIPVTAPTSSVAIQGFVVDPSSGLGYSSTPGVIFDLQP